MAQYVNPQQQQDVATTGTLGAGAGDHLPIGDYGGMDYRSAIRFAVPPGWTAWTAITSATLKVYISDHQHVAPKNSSIFCSRMNVPVWTKDQGTQDCENGFSGSNNTQKTDIQSVSTDRISFSSGSTANAAKTLDVTAMVRYYKANNSPLVFVFDNNGADQYTELWSLGHTGTTYDAVLTINYETVVAPNPPTLTDPSATDPVVDSTPTLEWTPDTSTAPQIGAEVQLYDAGGVAIGAVWPVAGAATTYDVPSALLRGTTYQWAVRTQNSAGWSAFSAKRNLTIKALPVVTITPIRFMDWDGVNHVPRLRVRWTCNQPQTSYQVDAGTYHSGVKTLAAQDHLLDTLAIGDNVAVSVTVSVTTPDGLTGTATRSFTPRYGLTTHKKTLLAVPTNWQTPVIVSSVPKDAVQGDCQLIIEYGTAATAGAAVPTAWATSLSAAPKTQYLHWRAWFIPNGNTTPTLDSIDIPYDSTVAAIDKWGTTKDVAALAPASGWAIDTGEYVYGSRSISIEPSGAATFCYAFAITLKKDRSYILTGLMKSRGNSGARIELQNAAGTVLQGGGMILPPGPVQTKELLTDTEWFTTDGRDVNRYSTPIYKAQADGEVVYVVLRANGASGTKAWFDAIKLEESTVATAWSPGAVGATIVDAGGVQVDGRTGGVFRYRGTVDPVTNPRALVEGGAQGLKFGGDAELSSPSAGVLRTGGELHAGSPTTAGQTGVQVKATGSIEVVHATAPYIDFKDSAAVGDYDARLVMSAPGVLETLGVVKTTGPMRLGGSAFPGSPVTGDCFFRIDLGQWFFWNGSAWVDTLGLTSTAMLTQSGRVTTTHSANNLSPGVAINFPRTFSGVPHVVVTSTNFNYYAAGNGAAATASVYTIHTRRLDMSAATASVLVDWIAYGPR